MATVSAIGLPLIVLEVAIGFGAFSEAFATKMGRLPMATKLAKMKQWLSIGTYIHTFCIRVIKRFTIRNFTTHLHDFR